jgi:hypothetical protein
VSRAYRYRLLTRSTPSAFERGRAVWYPYPLDEDALHACAAMLAGTRDFTAFTPSDGYHSHFTRTVRSAGWTREGDVLAFDIEADSFLRHMNRVLVGDDARGGGRTAQRRGLRGAARRGAALGRRAHGAAPRPLPHGRPLLTYPRPMDEDHGRPIAYLALEEGTAVYARDGARVGKVEHVLADTETDIFDGIVINTSAGPGGWRFADSTLVGDIFERAVFLQVDGPEADRLPEPTGNPAVVDADADDLEGNAVTDKLRRAGTTSPGATSAGARTERRRLGRRLLRPAGRRAADPGRAGDHPRPRRCRRARLRAHRGAHRVLGRGPPRTAPR